MLRFNASNVPQTSPFSFKQFCILGDGISDEITIDLQKAPLGMEFAGGKYPHTAFISHSEGCTNIGVIPEVQTQDGNLQIRFSKPLPQNAVAEVTVSFWYE